MLADYAALIRKQNLFVLEIDRTVQGVLVLIPKKEVMLLENITIRHTMQGLGLGRILLQFSERQTLAAVHQRAYSALQRKSIMPRRKLFLFGAIMMMTSAAEAQSNAHSVPPESFKFLASKDVAALTAQPGPGVHTAFLGDHENYYVEYASRTDIGNLAEVHSHWSHYITVLSGEAVLTYDGTVVNPKSTGPGQIRGTSITGGKSITVHAGDYVQIPAGTPHMFSPTKNVSFHYVAYNARQ